MGLKTTNQIQHSSLVQEKLESDLNILDCDSLLCLGQIMNSQIITILKVLGVRNTQHKEIIENHIYSVLADPAELKQRSENMVSF